MAVMMVVQFFMGREVLNLMREILIMMSGREFIMREKRIMIGEI